MTFVFHYPGIQGIHLELNIWKSFKLSKSLRFLHSKVNAGLLYSNITRQSEVTVQLAAPVH
jgi:hypothetical protein